MTSAISFQGLSTNLQTDKLVEAALSQAQAPLDRMQSKQDRNKLRASLIRTMRTNLQALNTTISSISSTAFQSRTVTSSDSTGSYVTATASGAATGTYEVVVSQTATKARLTSSGTVSSPDASLGGTANESGEFEYVLTNKDGKQTTYKLSAANNTAAGLRDAINGTSSDSGVNATLVQSEVGKYRLVIMANESGKGTSGSDSITMKGNSGNSLGFDSVNGSTSTGSELAVNALFSINGISMERTSNTITDAVDGVSLALKGKDSGKTTTLTVAVDKTSISTALNDVVAKYNAVYKVYKDNSGEGGALANDPSLRSLINQAHAALMGTPEGLSSDNTYQTAASLGLKTGRDGMMSVDASTLQDALDDDVNAGSKLFEKVATSFQTFTDRVAGYGSGSIANILSNIDNENLRLGRQISSGQARLEKQREALQLQYTSLEATVGQLQAMGQSLSSLR